MINKLINFRSTEELNKQIDDSHKKYIIETGVEISKSEFIRFMIKTGLSVINQ
jgi:hypothetical protein